MRGANSRHVKDSEGDVAGLHLGDFPFVVCLEDFRDESSCPAEVDLYSKADLRTDRGASQGLGH
jgi:hypothetical protein